MKAERVTLKSTLISCDKLLLQETGQDVGQNPQCEVSGKIENNKRLTWKEDSLVKRAQWTNLHVSSFKKKAVVVAYWSHFTQYFVCTLQS